MDKSVAQKFMIVMSMFIAVFTTVFVCGNIVNGSVTSDSYMQPIPKMNHDVSYTDTAIQASPSDFTPVSFSDTTTTFPISHVEGNVTVVEFIDDEEETTSETFATPEEDVDEQFLYMTTVTTKAYATQQHETVTTVSTTTQKTVRKTTPKQTVTTAARPAAPKTTVRTTAKTTVKKTVNTTVNTTTTTTGTSATSTSATASKSQSAATTSGSKATVTTSTTAVSATTASATSTTSSTASTASSTSKATTTADKTTSQAVPTTAAEGYLPKEAASVTVSRTTTENTAAASTQE